MWKRIEKKLMKITPIPITNSEKALGLHTNSRKNAIVLRNWVTFTMRHLILAEERKAFYIKNYHQCSVEKFFAKFNYKAQEELRTKELMHVHRGTSDKFVAWVTTNSVIASVSNGTLTFNDIMWKTTLSFLYYWSSILFTVISNYFSYPGSSIIIPLFPIFFTFYFYFNCNCNPPYYLHDHLHYTLFQITYLGSCPSFPYILLIYFYLYLNSLLFIISMIIIT